MSIFSPSDNTYRGQNKNEKTIFVSRRHWSTASIPVGISFFLAIIPFLIKPTIETAKLYQSLSSLYWFLSFVWILLMWNIGFYNIMLYFLNAIVITEKRIVQEKQKGFFDYQENEIELGKIQDISVKIAGSFETFMELGNIEIQSAGAEAKFYFDRFPDPQGIKKIITDLKNEL